MASALEISFIMAQSMIIQMKMRDKYLAEKFLRSQNFVLTVYIYIYRSGFS